MTNNEQKYRALFVISSAFIMFSMILIPSVLMLIFG